VHALAVSGLSRSFGSVKAVQNLTLAVVPGEIYGFLGLNGAGKTTSIRVALGLMHADAGEVRFFGKRLQTDRSAILRRVGSLVESATAYPNLTVEENLWLHANLLGLHAGAAAELDRVIDRLGLAEYRKRPAGKLSLGNRQRLALARALMGKPELLILDEPANGLDPAGMVEIRKLLLELAHSEGVAILMSSHLLDEVEQVADRVGIIHRGVLLRELTRAELQAGGGLLIELEVDDAMRAGKAITVALPQARLQQCGDQCLRVAAEPAALVRCLVAANVAVLRVQPVRTDLEALFLDLTGGQV